MSTSSSSTETSRLPLPVRLVDMRDLENRYLAASPDERMTLHEQLAFHELLTDEERFALERRFPHELEGDPRAPDASEGVRVSWDLRSREIIVCMLQFGDRALATRNLDLVRSVAPTEDRAVFAMTATGSFLELGCPLPDGTRHFVYRASARPGGQREEGTAHLTEPVVLGNRVTLGDLRTSELLILASGPELPAYDETVPGTMLHGPIEDTHEASTNDPMRVGMTRFRVMIDTAENAVASLRPALHERAAALAADLQQRMAPPGGGLTLAEAASFTTANGARLEVDDLGNAFDLVGRSPDGQSTRWLYEAYIGDQRLVAGAPLVIFHRGESGQRGVACIFGLARVERR